jgi:DNA-binding transcriptional MerR regulator
LDIIKRRSKGNVYRKLLANFLINLLNLNYKSNITLSQEYVRVSEEYYKLKEFARITNLSRKLLLLYEKNELLIPDTIDQNNSYRYYSCKQVQKASLLSLLRKLDIPLKDLSAIINNQISINSYFEKTKKRNSLIKEFNRIQHALQILSLSEKSSNFLASNVELSFLPKRNILYSEAWGAPNSIQLYFTLLFRYMAKIGINCIDYSFTWYMKDSSKNLLHFRTCCPVSGYFETGQKEIKCDVFPEGRVAKIRHFGNYTTLKESYAALHNSASTKDCKFTGDFIETYIVTGDSRYCDSSMFITDIAGVVQ